jgi:hypothetical protein
MKKKIGKLDFKIESLIPYSRDKEIDKIVSALKKMKKSSDKIENKITLLQLDRFLLPAIFLLEPVSKSALIQIVADATEDNKNSYSSTATALTMLTKNRFIELTAFGYKLTALGKNEFFSFRKKNSRNKQHDKTIAIDELRIDILNLKNRKKKLKV